MKLSNKLYDILKWVAIIFLDAFGNAYEQLAGVWNLPYGTEIMRTCSILSVFLGVILGISTYRYNKMEVDTDFTDDDELLTDRGEE